MINSMNFILIFLSIFKKFYLLLTFILKVSDFILQYIHRADDKTLKMQNNAINSNLFRKSYGFQSSNIPMFNTNNGINQVQNNNKTCRQTQQSYNSTIKQMENKLQNVQYLFKNKHRPQNFTQTLPNQQNAQKFRASNKQDLFDPKLMRGSCQDAFRSFDYNKYRNTGKINTENNNQQSNQIRRSPGGQNLFKTSQVNKIKTAQSKQFTKDSETQKQSSGFGYKISPSKNLTKFFNDKQMQKNIVKEIKKSPGKAEIDFQKVVKLKDQFKQIQTSLTINSMPQIEIQKQKVKSNVHFQINNHHPQKIFHQRNSSMIKHSKIINGFQFGPILGKGKFGEVFLARHHQTGFIAAIKKIEKQKIVQFKMVNQFVKQIRLHSCLDHPNIVKFFGIFEDGQSLYLVMEYLNGGTLFDHLNDVDALSPKQTAQFLKDVIEALCYMHDKSIAHRDIKPENIVISAEKVAKLCDFGWSALVQKSRKTYCGTLDYAPPEILERKDYDLSVDIWCIGVLAYELMTGKVPFEAEQRNIVRDKIINVDKMRIEYPKDMPSEARQFIDALIQKDPNSRPKCNELLKFNFFTMHLPKGMKNKKNQ